MLLSTHFLELLFTSLQTVGWTSIPVWTFQAHHGLWHLLKLWQKSVCVGEITFNGAAISQLFPSWHPPASLPTNPESQAAPYKSPACQDKHA